MQNTNQPTNHTLIIAHNSYWNFINYLTTGLTGILITIILSRYLGPQSYGTYAFLISFITVGSLILDFGIGQATYKYIPKYFNDPKNKKLATIFFSKTLKVQLSISLALISIAIITLKYWVNFININTPEVSFLIFPTLIIILPTIASKQFTNFLSATQNFKIIAKANILIQASNIFLLVLLTQLTQNVLVALLIYGFTQTFSSILLIKKTLPLIKTNHQPEKSLNIKDIKKYTSIAYINLILQFIVWSYSEVFFLNHYSPPQEIGFYTLAFSLAAIITALPALYLRITYNAQFELLEKGEEEKADQISSLNVKLMNLLFLPLAIFLTYFSKEIILILYGTEYLKVQFILPLVLFGAIIPTILGPATIKVNNDNKKFAITTIVIGVIGAIINLSLNYLLIPKYDSIGAGIANLTSQMLVAIVSVFYILKTIKIVIDWQPIYKTLLINLVFALVLLMSYILFSSVIVKISIFIASIFVYGKAILRFKIINKRDLSIIDNLKLNSPPYISRILRTLSSSIEKNIQ